MLTVNNQSAEHSVIFTDCRMIHKWLLM